jgi:hypothetical protein
MRSIRHKAQHKRWLDANRNEQILVDLLMSFMMVHLTARIKPWTNKLNNKCIILEH